MTPIVLIHGGGFDHRCWDLLAPLLPEPVLAVDLPGRGDHPAPLDAVNLTDCADSVVADIDDAGFDEVVLVGHSLAGCSLPGVVGRLGDRARHVVFIACTVPPDGRSALDTLDPEVQAMARDAAEAEHPEPVVMEGEMARLVLGDDLVDDQLAWCAERLVPEAMRLILDPVDLAPLAGVPATWIRTLQDTILDPEKQLTFAANVGGCPVVDLDAGHMCMVGRPAELAALIDQAAGTSPSISA